jgi:hypothetical protein
MIAKTLSALSMALLSAHTLASTLTFQQGVNGYTGTRDTELRYPNPDENRGSSSTLSVDYDDGPGDTNPTHGLLAFDNLFGNAPGQIKPTDTILGATLTLQISSAGSGWTWHEMLKPWNQNADTWNSWGNGIQPNGVEAVATPVFSDGTGDGNGNVPSGTYTLSVTSSLQKWQSGALANNGWAILPFEFGTNGIDFYTGDSTLPGNSPPLLTVTAEPSAVPLPAAVWLFGSAVLGIGALRRPRRSA